MIDNPKVILIIDDEMDTCDIIKSFLEARNHSVITASSRFEGF